ncbi:MAG: hypothetical protein ACK5M3_19110 [Dysgonomonas sp.]
MLYDRLKSIFPSLSFRPRVFGYDYEYGKNNLELFINTTDNVEYFIHINYVGSEKNLIQILKQLEITLDNLLLDFDLGYYEIDEDGNQISKDINLCLLRSHAINGNLNITIQSVESIKNLNPSIKL